MCLIAHTTGQGLKEAMEYLQTQVHPLVDHVDPEETEEFKTLSFWLFQFDTIGVWGLEASKGLNAGASCKLIIELRFN